MAYTDEQILAASAEIDRLMKGYSFHLLALTFQFLNTGGGGGGGGAGTSDATEATLLGIRDRIGNVDASGTGSVNHRLSQISAKINDLLTHSQLTASPLNVSVSNTVAASISALPLPAGAATDTALGTISTALGTLLTELQQKTEPANTQAVSAASLPLPTGAATETTLSSLSGTISTLNTNIAALNSNLAPATSVSSVGVIPASNAAYAEAAPSSETTRLGLEIQNLSNSTMLVLLGEGSETDHNFEIGVGSIWVTRARVRVRVKWVLGDNPVSGVARVTKYF